MQGEPILKSHRKPEGSTTVVAVGDVRFGDGSYPVIAGPLVVESESQVRDVARIVRSGGATVLRAATFISPTTAYGFDGLGEAGLHMLARAGAEQGLPTCTEVAEPGHVGLIADHVDMLQVGSDHMQNFALLRAVGEVDRPVLLKRGPSATIDEWLMAAEYILDAGNPDVVLVERGIRTFDPGTRSTLDIAAVPEIQRISHLPVVIAPGAASGRADLIVPLALAGRAAGADGLIVEVHPRPAEALIEGARHLDEMGYLALMDALGVPRLRDEIDRIDRDLVHLLARRLRNSVEIGLMKADTGLPLRSPDREAELLGEVRTEASAAGIDPDHVERMFLAILDHSRAEQRRAVDEAEQRRPVAG